MTQTETIFIAARAGIALLCLITLVIVWQHGRAGARFDPSQRAVLAFTSVLLLLAGVLTINDLRAALSPGEQMATYDGAWLWLVFDAGVPLLMLLALRLMRQRDAALVALEQASVTDALTGLANRRGFASAAATTLLGCHRRGEAASVVMFDLDRFKTINDSFGHAAGDAVLRDAAAALRRQVRATDVVARLGGEEFAVLCPATTATQAAELAERMREEIRRAVPHPGGNGALVTTSAGVAAVMPMDAGMEAALIAADQALYVAKKAGRDRVVVAGGDTTATEAPQGLGAVGATADAKA